MNKPMSLAPSAALARRSGLAVAALAVLSGAALASEPASKAAVAPPPPAPPSKAPADRPTGDQAAIDGDPARKTADKADKADKAADGKKNLDARLVQVTATLTVKVVHPDEVRKAALARLAAAGGHPTLVTENELYLEVPQSALADTVDQLAAAGIVLQKSLQRVDLTEQIVQLEAKLRSKREILGRMRSFFDDSDTQSTLRIESSMTQLVAEIEALQGELNVARASVRQARVQVSFQFHPRQHISYVHSPFGWLNTLDLDRFDHDFEK